MLEDLDLPAVTSAVPIAMFADLERLCAFLISMLINTRA